MSNDVKCISINHCDLWYRRSYLHSGVKSQLGGVLGLSELYSLRFNIKVRDGFRMDKFGGCFWMFFWV